MNKMIRGLQDLAKRFTQCWQQRMANRDERRAQQQRRAELLREIAIAHAEWESARSKLDCVDSKEQIDYAVYCFEAAQKRFEMLLRMAKRQRLKGSWYYR